MSIPYEPKVGETVRISPFFLLITEVSSNHIAGAVKVSQNETVFVRVPLQSAEPFDPIYDEAELDNLEKDSDELR